MTIEMQSEYLEIIKTILHQHEIILQSLRGPVIYSPDDKMCPDCGGVIFPDKYCSTCNNTGRVSK